ncbi:MAG: DUF2085 domain-containing protein [Candidatus Fermentibacteraceae bacterium]|nr:DUF2085 domain-containing protein [Candidatus Fermentibacteraceae bacterium]MBN2609007.1 DUF2085 domain-containing protein [Candidatus Fermentibacteraceae bacterium]
MRSEERGRLVLVFVLLLPSLLLFLMSMVRPVLGEAGNFSDPVLTSLCHRMQSRCIHLPWGPSGLCARCTAFWFGLFLGTVAMYRPRFRLPFWSGLPALLPLIADGLVQLCTTYQSSNPVRMLTGLAAGLGIAVVFLGEYKVPGLKTGHSKVDLRS